MAKYVIELDDEPMIDPAVVNEIKYYRCMQAPYWYVTENIRNKLTPYTEPDEQEIIEKAHGEAWELISEINCMSEDELLQAYGIHESRYIDDNYTYSEAKARYDEWKAEKEEIHVGDEVCFADATIAGVVVRCRNDGFFNVMDKTGQQNVRSRTEITKTNRYFPEVAELLEKMREEP